MVVINFSAGEQRSVFVPSESKSYEVVFSTDLCEFGGSGRGKDKIYEDRFGSIRVDLPPLTGYILRPTKKLKSIK
jgi:hypothetical protein